jgi:hypothetical protein
LTIDFTRDKNIWVPYKNTIKQISNILFQNWVIGGILP